MPTNKARPDRIVLASSSERRRQLLAEAGVAFEVVPPPLGEPEDLPAGGGPRKVAEALAYFKAAAVAERVTDLPILGADTVVSLGGRILGKPDGADGARRMLRSLSGTRHSVITGVALLVPEAKRVIASETTHVTMRAMSDAEVEGYVESGEWAGKAGAYAIQETADRFVERVEGSFSNVVGLPMALLERILRRYVPGAWPEGH